MSFNHSSVPHYHAIFSDICATRFQKLARFIFISSWALTILIGLPSGLSWWNVFLPFRTIPIAFSLFLLTCVRKNNLHVNFLGYKTLSSQIAGQLLNKKFIYNSIFYIFAAYAFFATLHFQLNGIDIQSSPMKHQYPPLNDKYVYYYYLSCFIGITYSLRHTILDHDRLIATYGSFHSHPKNTLIQNSPKIISNSILFTITNLIIAPIIYIFIRYSLYDIIFASFGVFLNLNQNYPNKEFLSFGFLFKTSLIAFLLIICFETVNTAFDAYLSIGCLHRGHTLSELSTDPLGTLITGLKSDKLFTKMTAFQELAYISKIENSEGRLLIYNSNTYKKNLWLDIFKECEKVIKENNSNINVLLNSINLNSTNQLASTIRTAKEEQNIFGRDYYTENNQSTNSFNFKQQTIDSDQSKFLDNNIITIIIDNLKAAVRVSKEYYSKFVASGFGIPFRYTIHRESERLCPNPSIVGNSIIAISLLATHSYNEDKKGTISSTIVEILEILEKSVNSCGRFISNPPEFLYNENDDNIISLLHELSMNAFFEVTLKYEIVLKDVVLSPDVLSLANWCLEQAYNELE